MSTDCKHKKDIKPLILIVLPSKDGPVGQRHIERVMN